MSENFRIITPWWNPAQKEAFLKAWGITGAIPDYLILQQDEKREGCARTKNKGIRKAIDQGAEYIIVLDDDCYPADGESLPDGEALEALAVRHIAALEPQKVIRTTGVMVPNSRGTVYRNTKITMPVAASMGFWEGIPDFDAASQLVLSQLPVGDKPPYFLKAPQWCYAFPLCGMNLAFRASEWPWCQFINVPRFDDIFCGWIWQRKAYAEGKCFNLSGPMVKHSRQSNVWQNLRDEALNIERNETLWSDIATGPLLPYEEMLARYGLSV